MLGLNLDHPSIVIDHLTFDPYNCTSSYCFMLAKTLNHKLKVSGFLEMDITSYTGCIQPHVFCKVWDGSAPPGQGKEVLDATLNPQLPKS